MSGWASGSAGNIASWKKKEGDEIAAGDSIAEIETDKATMEWEAQDDGFVAKILLEAGAKDIAVGEPAMVVVEEKVRSSLWTQHDLSDRLLAVCRQTGAMSALNSIVVASGVCAFDKGSSLCCAARRIFRSVYVAPVLVHVGSAWLFVTFLVIV